MMFINTDLNFDDLGRWPVAAKVIVILSVCFFLSGFSYWSFISPQWALLSEEVNKETELKQAFINKRVERSRLDAYNSQAEQIEQELREKNSQLPSKMRIADLLTKISKFGKSRGLTVESIKPQQENSLPFYAELPIQLKVIGKYHELGQFVTFLANMSHTVTFDEFVIKGEDASTKTRLVMEATVKIYRDLDVLEWVPGSHEDQ